VYALHVVDHKVDAVLGVGTDTLQSLPELLPEIRDALPPALADAFEDVRDPSYRDQVDVNVRLVSSSRDDLRQLVLDVTNNGDKTVTLMAVRVVLLDEAGDPVSSVVTYAATPLTVDQDWRGPILPGSHRICGEPVWRARDGLTPQVEIADIRVWDGSEPLASRSEVGEAIQQ